MKNHLKQVAAPRTWPIRRKRRRFILRPRSSGPAFSSGLPLGLVIRDRLHFASTTAEVHKLLQAQEVLVDGRRRTDPHFQLGLLDVVSIPLLKKTYRVVFDAKSRITLREISAAESSLKLCKVVGKIALRGGTIQYNLHDGKNLLAPDKGQGKAKVGDTLVVRLPQLEVQSILTLAPGVPVLLMRGKHAGQLGTLQELAGTKARYRTEQGEEAETARSHLLVVGEKTPLLSVR